MYIYYQLCVVETKVPRIMTRCNVCGLLTQRKNILHTLTETYIFWEMKIFLSLFLYDVLSRIIISLVVRFNATWPNINMKTRQWTPIDIPNIRDLHFTNHLAFKLQIKIYWIYGIGVIVTFQNAFAYYLWVHINI